MKKKHYVTTFHRYFDAGYFVMSVHFTINGFQLFQFAAVSDPYERLQYVERINKNIPDDEYLDIPDSLCMSLFDASLYYRPIVRDNLLFLSDNPPF